MSHGPPASPHLLCQGPFPHRIQTLEPETIGCPTLAAVHVVAKSQDNLEEAEEELNRVLELRKPP